MKTEVLRDFIVEKDLEEELLRFAPKSEKKVLKEWLKSQDLSY